MLHERRVNNFLATLKKFFFFFLEKFLKSVEKSNLNGLKTMGNFMDHFVFEYSTLE